MKVIPALSTKLDQIPTKTSELANDSGFLTTETDPVFSNSEAEKFEAGDKDKLDGIEDNANNYVLETHGNDKHSSEYITADDIPAIPSSIGDLSDVDDTGKATGKALLYNDGWKVRNREDIYAGGCTITRNEAGEITSVAYTNRTVTITRSEGLITSTTDGVYLRTVTRSEAGFITGVTVSEV